MTVSAHHHRTNGVTFQVKRHGIGITWQLDHLTLHGIRQAVDTKDTVSQAYHGPFGTRLDAGIEALDSGFDQFTDFGWIQLHCFFLLTAQ